MRSTDCARNSAATRWSRDWRWRKTSVRAHSLARLFLLHLQRRHLAADGEVGVFELQRARDAVLVDLEGNGIDWRLLAALLFLRVFLFEIADGHRPARELGER